MVPQYFRHELFMHDIHLVFCDSFKQTLIYASNSVHCTINRFNMCKMALRKTPELFISFPIPDKKKDFESLRSLIGGFINKELMTTSNVMQSSG